VVDSGAHIRISNLTHTYPGSRRSEPRTALHDVNLEIRTGEMVALLGPNGSGKSTLLRTVTTSLHPSGGSIEIGPLCLPQDAAEVRKNLGVVFQKPALDDKLTVVENLRAAARLHRVSSRDIEPRIVRGLENMDLSERRNELVGTLSGGLARRVELAKALLHDPDLLVLDEPTSGLDPASRHAFWQQIEHLRKERAPTILLTTHQIDEASRCDRTAILHQGSVLAFDAPEKLQAAIGRQVLAVRTDDADALRTALEPLLGIKGSIIDNSLRFELENSISLDEVLSSFGDRIRSLSVAPPSLEDVFFHFTGELLSEPED
jgi:ABC-2 type transport system ATP-binding protein